MPPHPALTELIQILSGKGGVGKSSITTQLALSLCLAGHSVGILDVDLTGPSIPRFLGVENAKITQAPGGWLPVLVHPSQILPPLSTVMPHSFPSAELPKRIGKTDGETSGANSEPYNTGFVLPNGLEASAGGATKNAPQSSTFSPEPAAIGSLHIMSLGFLLPSRSSAVVWRGPKKTAMVRQFLTDVLWPPGTKYLLIDTPPGTSDEHISLAETLLSLPPFPSSNLKPNPATSTTSQVQHLAGAVIVTTPQAVSVSDVRKELNFCKKVSVVVLGVVENMAGYVCECCGVCTNVFGKGGGEAMSQEFGVRFLGSVPVDAQWGSLVEEGKRPRYGEPELREEQSFAGTEDGPLVDKYRSCSLCPAFREIARGVIDNVDGYKPDRDP